MYYIYIYHMINISKFMLCIYIHKKIYKNRCIYSINTYVWLKRKERKHVGFFLLTSKHKSGSNECKNCQKHSRFQALSDVPPTIFKNDSLFLWNLDGVNFHCL